MGDGKKLVLAWSKVRTWQDRWYIPIKNSFGRPSITSPYPHLEWGRIYLQNQAGRPKRNIIVLGKEFCSSFIINFTIKEVAISVHSFNLIRSSYHQITPFPLTKDRCNTVSQERVRCQANGFLYTGLHHKDRTLGCQREKWDKRYIWCFPPAFWKSTVTSPTPIVFLKDPLKLACLMKLKLLIAL